MKVMVETSAHHVHVTKETLEALFGKGATLTNKKNLSQPGQFACVEKVTVVGPKSEMKMSILGPERSADQVEISLTDARKLGIAAPVRALPAEVSPVKVPQEDSPAPSIPACSPE